MTRDPEILILGAGPAGVGAALALATCGVKALIVDAGSAAGGQVYRPLPGNFEPGDAVDLGPDYLEGERQRRLLADSGVDTAFGRLVWSIGTDLRVDALGPDGPESWRPKGIVAATGATERVVPFPGWTLPGVMGLAAATILLKSQCVLPGKRVLVAGCGPLLFAVANAVMKGGGQVVALADLAGPGTWLRALPALLGRPRDLLRGAYWMARVGAKGVPMLFRHTVSEARASDAGLEVSLGAVDAAGRPIQSASERTLVADSLVIGHGLIPATEAVRLLGAEMYFDAEAGGWVPQLDDDQRASRPGLYAAGDGTGVRGAAAAFLAGQIAGMTAALDLGRIDAGHHARATGPLRRRLARAQRFGRAMARLMAPRSGQVEAIAYDTVVCRCEDVTRAEVEEALERGAADVNQLKSWTRCGMGPCQGRMCGDTVAQIVAARTGSRAAVGAWAARVPLRPLNVDAMAGEFDYDDIPIPTAAPL